MQFEYFITVRGYELDSFNHLNNSVYLNYTEQARWEILRELDLFDFFKKSDMLLVVVENHIRYHREAKIFDELVVKTRVSREEPYLIFDHSIYNIKTSLKINKSKVKTLLINSERIPQDIPEEFFKKTKN